MTFNRNADISGNRVRMGTGRKAGVAVGGLSGVGLLFYLALALFTGDVAPLIDAGLASAGQGQYQPADGSASLEHCLTGADANEFVDCRMQATAYSLDAYWSQTLPAQAATEYIPPDMVLFQGSVSTGCGAATSAVGPFYCPADQTVYLDTSFFDELTTQYGADGGALAELYVVAHEFGHHIQSELGTMKKEDTRDSGTASGSVRLELQADCYAGMWVQGASKTYDQNGVAYLQEPTQSEIASALSAAAAVGDDHIQETFQGTVTPHTWTHGSSEQRQKWFTIGMTQGTLQACDTFAVSAGDL